MNTAIKERVLCGTPEDAIPAQTAAFSHRRLPLKLPDTEEDTGSNPERPPPSPGLPSARTAALAVFQETSRGPADPWNVGIVGLARPDRPRGENNSRRWVMLDLWISRSTAVGNQVRDHRPWRSSLSPTSRDTRSNRGRVVRSWTRQNADRASVPSRGFASLHQTAHLTPHDYSSSALCAVGHCHSCGHTSPRTHRAGHRRSHHHPWAKIIRRRPERGASAAPGLHQCATRVTLPIAHGDPRPSHVDRLRLRVSDRWPSRATRMQQRWVHHGQPRIATSILRQRISANHAVPKLIVRVRFSSPAPSFSHVRGISSLCRTS